VLEPHPVNDPHRVFRFFPQKSGSDVQPAFFPEADKEVYPAALFDRRTSRRVLGDHHITLDRIGPDPGDIVNEEASLPQEDLRLAVLLADQHGGQQFTGTLAYHDGHCPAFLDAAAGRRALGDDGVLGHCLARLAPVRFELEPLLVHQFDDRDNVLACQVRNTDLLLAEKQGDDGKGADHADHDQRQKYPDAFNKPVHDER
jgi:hypothetical protein